MDPAKFNKLSDYEIIDICEKMDTKTLYNFVKTNKRMNMLCQAILSNRKKSENKRNWASLKVSPINKRDIDTLDDNLDEVQSYFAGDSAPDIRIIDGSYYLLDFDDFDEKEEQEMRETYEHNSVQTIGEIKYKIKWIPEQQESYGEHV